MRIKHRSPVVRRAGPERSGVAGPVRGRMRLVEQQQQAGFVESGPVTLNWETWNDHYLPPQLTAVKKQTGIAARPSLESDDSDGYLKVKQTGGQYDIVSTDALWAPKFFKDGLTDVVRHQLDPGVVAAVLAVAKEVPFWNVSGGYLVYPNGWSSVNIYYNPKYVVPAPTSWEVLTEPKYAGKVVAENQPTDLMAMAGLATGAKQPYGMTTAEISRAQDFLKSAKPAFLKLVSQNSDSVRALADGSAWMALENLGTDFRVKAAGGPDRQDRDAQGGRRRVDRRRADGQGLRAQEPLQRSSSTRWSRRRGSRRTSSRTAGRCSTRRRTRCSSTRGTRSAPTSSTTTSPTGPCR